LHGRELFSSANKRVSTAILSGDKVVSSRNKGAHRIGCGGVIECCELGLGEACFVHEHLLNIGLLVRLSIVEHSSQVVESKLRADIVDHCLVIGHSDRNDEVAVDIIIQVDHRRQVPSGEPVAHLLVRITIRFRKRAGHQTTESSVGLVVRVVVVSSIKDLAIDDVAQVVIDTFNSFVGEFFLVAKRELLADSIQITLLILLEEEEEVDGVHQSLQVFEVHFQETGRLLGRQIDIFRIELEHFFREVAQLRLEAKGHSHLVQKFIFVGELNAVPSIEFVNRFNDWV